MIAANNRPKECLSTAPAYLRRLNAQTALAVLTGCAQSLVLQAECHTIIVATRPTFIECEDGSCELEIIPGEALFIPAGACQQIDMPGTFDLLIAQSDPRVTIPVSDRPSTHEPLGAGDLMLVSSPEQINAIAQFAMRTCASDRAQDKRCVQSIIDLLLAEVAFASSHQVSSFSCRNRELNTDLLRKLDEFIEENLEEPLRLSALAEFADMTDQQLSRQFKLSTGVSPTKYIIQRRIQRAKEMLEKGSTAIVEIAYATGFSSQSHLTETFKRHMGVPPGEYMRRQRSASLM